MFIQKAGTTSKNPMEQKSSGRLGLELFLALLIIASVPDFHWATRRRKLLTKFVHATPAYAGTTTESVRTKRNALLSSLVFYNGSLLRKQITSRLACPKKSLEIVRPSVPVAILIRRLEKDAALASRRLEKLGKKSSGGLGRMQDYTDALKLAKTIASRCGSNVQQ